MAQPQTAFIILGPGGAYWCNTRGWVSDYEDATHFSSNPTGFYTLHHTQQTKEVTLPPDVTPEEVPHYMAYGLTETVGGVARSEREPAPGAPPQLLQDLRERLAAALAGLQGLEESLEDLTSTVVSLKNDLTSLLGQTEKLRA